MAHAPLTSLVLPLPLPLLLLAALTAVAGADEPCARTPGPQSAVARLKEQLLRNYVTDEAPPTEGGLALPVEHAVLIKHIPGIYYNMADVQVTFAMTWRDSRLAWDPAQYNNLVTILVDPGTIWIPFIGIQSHPTTVPDWVDLMGEMCVVSSAGNVMCMTGVMLSAHCLSDYSGWPQDLHNCSFHIGSWMYSSQQLYLTDLHIAVASGPGASWLVKDRGVVTANASVGPDGRVRSVTTIWLQLAHQEAVMAVAAYSAALALAVLTLSSLLLPSACGERLALGTISILAHCVVLLYLSWWMEGGARAPRIILFHRDGICAAGAALLLVVVVGRLQASRRAAPAWLSASLARLRASPAGALLLPPAAKQPGDKPAEAPAANASTAPDADVEAPRAGSGGADGEGDANGGGTDALVAPDANAATDSASDAECWRAASVLVERLGKSGVCAALLAALLRLLLNV